MTCEHLTETTYEGPVEISAGSPYPKRVKTFACGIAGMQPDTLGWASKCQETASEGPCWWWAKYHAGKPDLDF